VAVSSETNALNNVLLHAVAVDRFGCVLDVNHAAEAIFDSYLCIRNRRLASGDLQTSSSLEKLIERLRATPEDTALQSDPVVVRRPDRGDIVIHALPVHGAARTPFLGARALLIFASTEPKLSAKPELLANLFELTPAEAKLASIMSEGLSPEQAAARLGISHNTARNQLRAVFTKTATHRQSKLVALLSRIQAGENRS
jgi:DNA-binding CsgD family transcriptional regulator